MADSLDTLRTLREQALDDAAVALGAARTAEAAKEREVSQYERLVQERRNGVERFRATDAAAAEGARVAADFVLADAHLRVLIDRVREAREGLEASRQALSEARRAREHAAQHVAQARAELRAVEKTIDRRTEERATELARLAEAELE